MLPKKRNLEMVQGDTLAFGLSVVSKSEVELHSIDFSCAESYSIGHYIFHKSLGYGIELVSSETIQKDGSEYTRYIYRIRVAPDDTDAVSPGSYNYDLQISTEDDVFTLLLGNLTILPQVTIGR